ncbi:hypothetical protein, conserved [Leishmania lindenbergi]|uniref:Uncharacterized protein n=1 Tax=Leishmania lindenbergi TaxID=651832 RepID=A0AAW3AFC8_9TRYP
MPRTAYQADASRGDSVASSSLSAESSPSEVDSRRAATKGAPAAAPSSEKRAVLLPPEPSEATKATEMMTDVTEGGSTSTAHTPSKGTLTESERRRQKTLFLGESEQFAFDFGGTVTEIAETSFKADAAQQAAQRVVELEDTTTRLLAASASHATAAPRPLTLEEVNAYATDAMQQGPRRFLMLAKAGLRKRGATATSSAHAPQNGPASVNSALSAPKEARDEDGATLAEAIPQFQAALRRYEADLWRAHRQHREEEALQRSKSKRNQRA